MASIDDFVELWQLNEASQKFLFDLSPTAQQDVIATFAPRDTSRDVNGLFISFVKSRKGEQIRKCITPKQPHHIDFFDRWNLTESSQNALLGLPPDAQADIIVKFEPRDTSRDANALFMSFIKSRAANMKMSPLRTHPVQSLIPVSVPRSPEPQISQVDVNQFINTWNLNEISENFLLSIPGHLQRDIIEKFSPRDTDRDMNGVFLAYAKSRMARDKTIVAFTTAMPQVRGGPVAIPEVNSFISRNDLARKWNLNHASLSIFDSLQTDVQNRVAKEFSPRDTSRDANKCFIAFCRSRAAIQFVDRWALNEESCKMFSSLEPDIQHLLMTTFAPRDTSRDVNAVFQAYVRSRQNAANADRKGLKRELDEIPAFVQRWQLKTDNAQMLISLDPGLAKDIMTKFCPRDTSRDCNAVFAKFAAALSNSNGNSEKL